MESSDWLCKRTFSCLSLSFPPLEFAIPYSQSPLTNRSEFQAKQDMKLLEGIFERKARGKKNKRIPFPALKRKGNLVGRQTSPIMI